MCMYEMSLLDQPERSPDLNVSSFTLLCIYNFICALLAHIFKNFLFKFIISQVEGMTELNGVNPIKIKVLGPYTFSIGDTSAFSEYIRGGIATEIKMPTILKFDSFEEQRAAPSFLITDYGKFDHPAQLHLAFNVLHEFIAQNNGEAPRPWNNDDAAAFLNMAKIKKPADLELNEKLLTTFAKVIAVT